MTSQAKNLKRYWFLFYPTQLSACRNSVVVTQRRISNNPVIEHTTHCVGNIGVHGVTPGDYVLQAYSSQFTPTFQWSTTVHNILGIFFFNNYKKTLNSARSDGAGVVEAHKQDAGEVG
jgi:hypothetical protein